MTREHMRDEVKAKAHAAAENRVIEAVAGKDARAQTREMFRDKLKRGELDDTMIELEVADHLVPFPMMEIPGMPPGQGGGMMNLGDIFGKGVRRPEGPQADDRGRQLRHPDRRGGRQASRRRDGDEGRA
jgi:ATP-dependent protease HslVU (ClpYQ) ATPase subunit